MNDTVMMALGNAGAFAAISLAALGSAFGTGAAGTAAVGAWKKCYAQNKPAPFQLVVFAGAPLSQTIYGMIIMFLAMIFFKQPGQWPFFLILGVVGGLAMGASAWMQGKAAAGACDALADTGKGFVNYLMVLGIIETVAIFVMAFGIVIMAMFGGDKKPAPDTGADQPPPAVEKAVPGQS
jgi:V/A-type H+-transporting ATPase subunit K